MMNTDNTVIIDDTQRTFDVPVQVVPEVMIWTDMEATGLDDIEDVPVELGVVVTDLELNVLHERKWYIREEGWYEKLSRNPIPLKMHTDSGLVDELTALPEWTRIAGQVMSHKLASVSFQAWNWLTDDLHLPAGVYPMCGSSIFYDRRFAIRQLPVFNGFFHYRNIDISSIKELCKRYNPKLYQALLAENERTKLPIKTHRVLDDIRATLAEAKFYIDQFFFVEMPGDDETDGDFMKQDPLPGM